jgi:Alpha-glutamyl/putrescinyl thymine pyrophosphorylase clade 3
MPTFCRHNRFVERCPICSRALPGSAPGAPAPRRAKTAAGARSRGRGSTRTRAREEGVRVHREGRAEDDGYRSELASGLRASADARRLAHEIAFSSGRLLALGADPPELYGEIRALARDDLERATWACLLTAYLCPLEREDPFVGIRAALAAGPGELPELEGVPLGPRSSHDPRRGAGTLLAYLQWVARAGGDQRAAFTGDPAWGAQRRFERLFERLALPGFSRAGRYELLVLAGQLGLYETVADSLHLIGARGQSAEDATTLAAKRVFGIGDPLLLERRAATLAQAASVPIEALELALANWASEQPATLGFPREITDAEALRRAGEALGL